MSARKAKARAPRVRPQPRPPHPAPAADDLRRAARFAERARREAEGGAKLAALPVRHGHAAGIDVGDASHWACVEATPDGSGTARESPAHTAGLRQLVAWLRPCAVTTVALEASGVYGHVLSLTPPEAGLTVVMTPPQFARQIEGRPKTDRRDCPWTRRLHKHGLLPAVFQPGEATQTLRDYARQRANLVRLSGRHARRLQKALGLVNLKLTGVRGDVTGVTGLKIIRAILAGERDPRRLAEPRDRRRKHSAEEIATALDGRCRPEHLLALRCGLALWGEYQRAIAAADQAVAAHLRPMRRQAALPELPPKTRVRGRKPHDPGFDARPALYDATGVGLAAVEGIDELPALALVSERGTDFSKWPTAKQFTSWLGLCPDWQQAGGKVRPSRTRRGKSRAAGALRLAAWGLMRSEGYPGAYLRRQRSRLGAPKAITAAAHEPARVVYNLMRYGLAYVRQAEEAYAEQVRERLEKQLRRRAKELGYELTKVEAAAPEGE